MKVGVNNQHSVLYPVQHSVQHLAQYQKQHSVQFFQAIATIAALLLGTGLQTTSALAQSTPLSAASPATAPIATPTPPFNSSPSALPSASIDRNYSPIQPNRILESPPLLDSSHLSQPTQATQLPIPSQIPSPTRSPYSSPAPPNPSFGQPASGVTPNQPPSQPSQPLFDRLFTAGSPEVPALGSADIFLPHAQTIRLVIVRSERRVYVYENDQLKTSYPVAIGKEGWETPLGTWQVIQMIEHPAWQHPFTGEIAPPGSDNPLGARWIGFWTDGKNFIGFHGTPNQESVGQPASHGCVRMYDEDVIALFSMVSLGTPVQVVP